MHKAILFDWGNTLMIDDKTQQGKMRYWDKIQLVNGASETLRKLSSVYPLYVAIELLAIQQLKIFMQHLHVLKSMFSLKAILIGKTFRFSKAQVTFISPFPLRWG